MFSCEFCEISHNTVFKEPLGQLPLHKHSFCLLSRHNVFPFQKRCYTYFPTGYFLGLIYTLGTRVSSIFQTLWRSLFSTQSNICDWTFSAKIANSLKPLSIFAKKKFIVVIQPSSKPSKHLSWWRRLQDVLIKTNMFALALRLQKTSSRRRCGPRFRGGCSIK